MAAAEFHDPPGIELDRFSARWVATLRQNVRELRKLGP